MKKTAILEEAKKNSQHFAKILEGETYQLRGVFNSEALLLVSIATLLNVKHIVESGRARGHSTSLLAKFFLGSNVKITSIDFDNTSLDAKYSEKYLAQYPNVTLVYGDANTEIEKQVTEDCVVFIDGPKGDSALQLAARLMENSRVKAVAIHDLHKNTWHRNIAETIFTNHFFSDDPDFVEDYRNFDETCWEVLQGTGEAPYTRYNKKIESYASTVGVFFNSNTPLNQIEYTNYREYCKSNKPTLKSALVETVPHDSFLYIALRRVSKLFSA